VAGAVLAPMSRISSAVGPVPRDRVVYVMCQRGNCSRSMANLLTLHGYDAVSVEGGALPGSRPADLSSADRWLLEARDAVTSSRGTKLYPR
jgi:rhodanese-related sulfurtransferase